MSELERRYREITERISLAARAVNRVDDVNLIVISKNHPVDLVRELYELGQRDFGENRDQEASPKAEASADLVDINWHFVGQLQSNKVKSALKYSRFIHSIDRVSLVAAMNRELANANESVAGFIQLNLTDDPARGGIQPSELLAFAEMLAEVPNFQLLGVMGVAALGRDPRIDFEVIQKSSERLQELSKEARFISAGMSHDFELAIEFGATHLRIGTAITGNRNL